MSDIPAEAEQIDYLPLLTPIKRPSKFAPGYDAIVTHLSCAACRADLGEIDHKALSRDGIVCECGLQMKHGNAGQLAIWRETVSA